MRRALMTGSCTLACLVLSPSCRMGYESLVGSGGGQGLAGATPGVGGEREVASGGRGGTGGLSQATGGSTGGNVSGGRGGTGGSGGSATSGGGSGGTLGFAGDSSSGGVASGGAMGAMGGASGGSLATGGGPAASSYCDVLPHLSAVPTLDGAVDGGLSLELLSKAFVRFPADNAPEFRAVSDLLALRFAVAWHESGLYFYAEVTDPDRYPATLADEEWKGDAIEFYVDSDGVSPGPGIFDNPGARSFVVEAPPDVDTAPESAGLFLPFVDAGDWSATNYFGEATADGYVIEGFVDGASLGLTTWTLQAGAPVGFDLAHDFSFPGGETGSEGRRMGHYFLQIAESGSGSFDDYPFFNTQVYCTPDLAP